MNYSYHRHCEDRSHQCADCEFKDLSGKLEPCVNCDGDQLCYFQKSETKEE